MEDQLTTVKRKPSQHHKFLWLVVVFMLGGLSAFMLRFSLVKRHDVHYHANFALYINGQRDQFKSFTYYEEENACSGTALNDPKTRVHMHDEVDHLVHVHDNAVTWGHFFANLGYTLGDKVLATHDGVFVDGQNDERLRFILNGQSQTAIANRVIKSEDRLLIDYSSDTLSMLDQRFKAVESDAHKYNLARDPATCTGGEHESFIEHVKRTLGVGYN